MKIYLLIWLIVPGSWSAVIGAETGVNKTDIAVSLNDNVSSIDTLSVPVVIPHIVGGVPAYQGEFPWLVNLRINTGEGVSLCGGAIIDWNLVLTAAHCVVTDKGKPVTAKSITVNAGDHDFRLPNNNRQQVTASGVKVHESYNTEILTNDIALIRLSKRFNATKYVNITGLPANGNLGSIGTVAGWGTRSFGGQVSDTLLKVSVPIVTNWTCTGQLGNPAGQFCAGATGRDSCQGDSGGPFICNNAPNTVCGIVSHGYGCGLQSHPGVYTKVSYYVPWIKDNSGGPRAILSSSLTVTATLLFIFVFPASRIF